MQDFTINKIVLPDLKSFPYTGQEWMRSVKRAITGGVYTPTLTNVANVTASTAYECQYQQVENKIFVSGKVDIDPTAVATTTTIELTLPFPVDFTSTDALAGQATCPTFSGVSAAMYASTANNTAVLEWVATDPSNQSMYFQFMYNVFQ